MLYGLLLSLFIFICFSLILLILIQKGKGSMGLGSSYGGAATMLFGGSGGQDIFQKITWILGAIFMGGSLILGLIKSSALLDSRYIKSPKALASTLSAAEELTHKTEPAETSSEEPAQATKE